MHLTNSAINRLSSQYETGGGKRGGAMGQREEEDAEEEEEREEDETGSKRRSGRAGSLSHALSIVFHNLTT